MASLVAGAVLAAPGIATAATAGTLPPKQPLVADLSIGTRPCAAGEERPYLRSRATVTARLYGPGDNQPGEASRVAGEFEAWWKDGTGVEQRATFTTGMLNDTAPYKWQLPDTVPTDTVVSLRVRAVNDNGVSPWSSEGEGQVCEFVHDNAPPQRPVVSSADYPDDDAWTDGVGVHGSFHIESASDDVVLYRYNFIGGPLLTVAASGPDNGADISYLPKSPGLHGLEVQAFDRASNSSIPRNYQFRVATGRTPAAHWKLNDAEGSPAAAAEAGPVARAGAGAVFGSAGPSGTAVASTVGLDGTGNAFLTPDTPVVAAGQTFAVGGWVRPAAVDGTRTIAAQDASGGSAFTLGLSQSEGRSVWSFDVGGTRLTGGRPEVDEWAYVLGQYDARTGKARLHVNGRAMGEEQPVSPVAGGGNFQIGRAQGPGGHQDHWRGEIGDVRVHDRVVVPDELTGLASRKARLRGHWALETAPDGLSAEADGGEPLKLGPGASIYRPALDCDPLDPECFPEVSPIEGEGHLALDGTSGYAATQQPVVDTGDSFTVTATVRLADSQPDRPMTVLSQSGEHRSAFKVCYGPATDSWELVVPAADTPGAAETVAARIPSWGAGYDQRLAVVYDDATDEVRLYVNGQTNAEAGAEFHDARKSTGGLQVGRGITADGWGEYLHGDVDQVRAFAGALTGREIALLR